MITPMLTAKTEKNGQMMLSVRLKYKLRKFYQSRKRKWIRTKIKKMIKLY